MDKKQAQELSDEISKRPWIYRPLFWILNKASIVVGWLFRFFGVLLLCVGLIGCGKADNKAVPTSIHDPRPEVQAKVNLYLSLGSQVQDVDGFIDFEHCDSVLFSGLLGTTKEVNLEAARDASGKWHRRPLSYEACYPNHSKSEISRDMYLGIMWYIWENKRLDLAEDLFAYGQAHEWMMGEGDVSRIYFTPGLRATLAEMIYRLGGKNHEIHRAFPQSYANNVGFAAHLDVLHILLRGEMLGAIEDKGLQSLKYNFQRSPRNALFSYAYHRYFDGDQAGTYALLLNEQWWPADRLPTSADRCETWMVQRDEGKDWEPCEGDKTHSGGDFLFVAKLLLRS